MPLHIASLNSGSNANCYYIGNGTEAVLVDAGLSCRETEKRMNQLGLDMKQVKALFISHEHTDHITGMTGIAKKYKLPVYISERTLAGTGILLPAGQANHFSQSDIIHIGNLSVIPFQKKHDAADPFSFMVHGQGINIGIITDIGHACKEVIHYFKQCHAVFLEANYCDTLLTHGHYPPSLQKRIRGKKGHLSNDQALDLFRQHRPPQLQLLILSHLSKNNNRPELVEQLFTPHAGDTRIFIASRYVASPIFSVESMIPRPLPYPLKISHKKDTQLKLF